MTLKKVRNTIGSVYCFGQLVFITGILMHLCENKSKECNNFATLDVRLIFYDKNISLYQSISE